MNDNAYKIHKEGRDATLWIHPEGPVRAQLFLQMLSDRGTGAEQPLDVLNSDPPFIVVQCVDSGDTRFYSKRSLVRVQHESFADGDESADVTVIPCELSMMDGSSLRGTIREFLLPEQRRLFDYLNLRGEQFLRLVLDDGIICLVNKAYIVRAVETEPNEQG